MNLKDLTVPIAAVMSIIIIIVPFPALIMDVFLAVSIGLALIILLNTIYSKEPLDMAMFPTILILVTLYRLSLNVASTRLIIGKADAGHIIETFGGFVTGGSLIVGIIVFIIIVLVQFIVITKGAERVAEVSARFTLDAMPGKQMAIDADLNSGLIDEQEARKRRKKIQDEAGFYGSMDGATKFVKGDAILGIIVIFVNIIGGIIAGVSGLTGQTMTITDALETYTRLTIGDGLVSQVPAFLISIATAILVTKGSSSGDMNEDLRKQLFNIPQVLQFTAVVMLALGLIPGLQVLLLGSGVCFMFSNMIKKNLQEEAVAEEIEIEQKEEQEATSKPENVRSQLKVDPIELEFGYGILPLADANQGGDLLERVKMIRRQVAFELGAVVPVIRLRDNIQLNPNEYIIKIKGVEVSHGSIMFDHYMAMNPGYIDVEIEGIKTVEPAFNLPAVWITEDVREEAEARGYTVVDAPSIMTTHLTEVVKKHLHELLSRQEIQELVNQVKETNPALIEELVPRLMNLGEIQKVLSNLVKEGISIRDLVSIFESLADNAGMVKDTDILTEYVRKSMPRQISKMYFDKSDNKVITLDPRLEKMLMENLQSTERGSVIVLDPDSIYKLFDSVDKQSSKLLEMGKTPILLTSSIVRIYLKKLLEQNFKDLVILSYDEVEQSIEVESVGMVSFE